MDGESNGQMNAEKMNHCPKHHVIIKATHILAQAVTLFFLPQHHAYFAHLLLPPSRMHCSGSLL
jgi:hypothetical protein